MAKKEPQNCWEFHHCPKKVKEECPAYKTNMGRSCWVVASGFYPDGCPKAKGRGVLFCAENCAWFKKMNPDF